MYRRAFSGLVLSLAAGGCLGGNSGGVDEFVVENRSESPVAVEVEVRRGDETLLSGCYEPPADTGLRFVKRFPWGVYAIQGRIDGEDWQRADWNPERCSGSPNAAGNRNAGFVVTDSAHAEVVQNVCDYVKLGETYVADYAPAGDYTHPCE